MVRSPRRRTIRERVALGLNGLAQSVMMLGSSADSFGAGAGNSGYAGARRSTRRTRGWKTEEGSPATDILTDLGTLRGRSRDLERNQPLALGAIQTKTNGVVGGGLKLRSVLDHKVLGITPEQKVDLQYQIEREWDLFEAECDFTGQQHFKDLQRLIYRSARVSGDIGIARRWRKRPGETYGTRIVLIEADRISNPNSTADSDTLQAGVALTDDGEIRGYHVSKRHPGDMRGAPEWRFVPRRGAGSGMLQMILAAQVYRPGQVRGAPLFAPIIEDLKQLGDYREAELKAAINDAFIFAFEEVPAEVDEEGNPILVRSDGETDAEGELTLQDLTITTLPPGSKMNVKKPERPNAGFGPFFDAFCKCLGAALELPFEVLLMHFSSSYSASKGALEVARKAFIVDQEWLVRAVIDPIRVWQFTEMVAAGRFDALGFFDDPLKRAAWLGRIWLGPTGIQLNPASESTADKTDIETGVKTREQVMTERTGGDFDTKSAQVLHEREVLGPLTPAAAVPEKADDKTKKDEGE